MITTLARSTRIVKVNTSLRGADASPAGAILQLGDWDASVGTLPTSPGGNSAMYSVSVSGTVNGLLFNVGDFLIWSLSSNTWQRILGSSVSAGGVTELDHLSDVNLTVVPTEGDSLVYRSGEFVAEPVAAGVAAPVDSVNGKTGVVVITATDVGLDQVSNTSDLNKPTSLAQGIINSAHEGRLDTSETKLAGIADNANAYVHPASHSTSEITGLDAALSSKLDSSEFTKVSVDALGIDSDTVNGLTVQTAVPAGAVFTDTIYDDTAIQAAVALNTAKVSNVDHPLVETAVPLGAVFTDTISTTDHTQLSNIGSNSHTNIDTHIADDSKHFTQASISITKSQVSDFGSYATPAQGALADSASQAGDGLSTFVNDVGYITSASAAPVDSVAGKTGVVTLDKADVGLTNVDNTTDALKPVSTAQQSALDTKLAVTLKGAVNGLAELDATGKVPTAQISGVPIEVVTSFPGSPVAGTLYIQVV